MSEPKRRKVPTPDFKAKVGLEAVIDEEFTRHPFYGRRKRVVFLKVQGHTVNRKRVQRLMRQVGLAGRGPTPVVRTRSTRSIPTCYAAFRWCGRIKCGVRTSPTSGCRVGSPTWLP